MAAPVITPIASPDRLLDPEFHASAAPHAVWRWMRQHAPAYWHPPSNLPGFWSFTRYEDIHTIYSNPRIFSSARGVLLRPIQYGDDPGGGLTLALTDPPRHKQLRSIMAGWFTMRYAQSLEEWIRHKLRELLARGNEQDGFDFTQDITARLSLYVTCHILGVPESEHDNVFHWTHEAFESGRPLAAHHQFMLFFGDLMEWRMANPGEDLVSALVHGMADDELLAEDEILLNFENLVGATENAGLSMSGGILAFLEHPDSWCMLAQNRELLPSAIEEVLRWTSSATHSMRRVTEPTIVNHQQLETGNHVVLWLPSGNRDENIFRTPNQFDITRRPNRHLALGYGEHFCIGNALARTQMRILLSELLDRKTPLEMNGKPVALRSIHVNGPAILPVRFAKKI